jgi:hypothetical protein
LPPGVKLRMGLKAGVSFGRAGFKPPPEQISSDLWLCEDPNTIPFHAPVSKLSGETTSWIRAWSLIRNTKNNCPLVENCHVTVKSEALGFVSK